MDFSFSQEQQMVRDSVARLLQDKYDFDARQAIVNSDKPWSAEIWEAFSTLGLLGMPLPESKGGFGGSISDVVSIAEVFGAHLLVEPYISSILLSSPLLAASDTADADVCLRAVLAGQKTVAFAHEEGKGTQNPAFVSLSARKTENGYRLDGDKRMVLGAAHADLLIVTARVEGQVGDRNGLALFMIDPRISGVKMAPFQTIDGRAAAHIRFDDVDVPLENMLDDDAFDAINSVVAGAIIALSAEAVGAIGALLNLTSEYAATRKQFGVAIGTFQAISHKLADMKIAHVKARSTLIYTTALAEAGNGTARDISVLKGQVGKLGKFVGECAIQIHGGVGMTDELNIGHFHKRLIAIDALFGDSEYHFRILGTK